MPENDNMPPVGEGPYIDKVGGVSPTIPVGTEAISIKGGRFDLDPTGLVVEIQVATPSIVVKTAIAVVDANTLTVKPTWPSGISGGSASIVVRNGKGNNAQPLSLIRFGFSTSSSAQISQLAKPQWLAFGQSAGMSHLYVFEPPTIIDTPYTNGTLGTSALLMKITTAARAAPTDLDKDGATDFAITDSLSPASLSVCMASTGFSPAFPGTFTSPWKPAGLSAVAAGSYDANRSMIAVASQGSANLFNCITASSPFNPADPCKPVGALTADARALWINMFGAPRADILSMDITGKLSLWRSDNLDNFSDQTKLALDAAIQGKTFLAIAVGDIDGKSGDDIIAVDGQGLFTLLNNGAGILTATRTTIFGMPQARALTIGDVDGDGKADIVLTAASTGALWVLRNQTDALGKPDWLIPGPVLDQSDMQPSIGANGIATLDGSIGDRKRRLVTTDIAGKKLVVWTNNTTQ
jgi:hypothetical protein